LSQLVMKRFGHALTSSLFPVQEPMTKLFSM
jgi:hypothetical protein